MRDVYRIKYAGAVDADGHILEPPDLWERYLEPPFRERALRLRTDEEGLEYLEIGGKPSLLSRRGFPGTLGAMGKTSVEDVRPSPERTYLAGAPHGSMNARERLERLDVMPFTWSRLPHGHPDHDPLFAAAQDLDVPLALHPGFEPPAIASMRFTLQRKTRLLSSVTAADGVRHAFTTLFDFGVFDRFPGLRVVVLESGAGWIGYWLDRLDAVYEATFIGERVPLDEKPSHYFKTRCYISADPDERTIPALVDLLGSDRFFWASDYPHADHTASYMREVEELAGLLDEPARRRFLGDNVRELYGIR